MNKQPRKDGPVNVEGNITPITRQPIAQVDAQTWHDMSINDLYDQRSILYGRMVIASQLGNPSLLQQVQFGVNQLDALIERKTQMSTEE